MRVQRDTKMKMREWDDVKMKMRDEDQDEEAWHKDEYETKQEQT